jgi:Lon protease-like protein
MQEFRLPTSGVVPVFPLPNAVLFPQTVLPLHIFEPRYRAMVRDVRAGDEMIAIALLKPGFENDYEGSPAIHTLGTVGHVEQLEPLPDGRFKLNLVGLLRVELEEIPSGKPYRQARLTPRPERGVDESDPDIRRAKLELLASQGYLMREITAGAGSSIPLFEGLPFHSAVNGACANLPAAPAVRQELLEIDDLLSRHRRVLRLVNQVLERVLELKGDKPQDPGDHGLN